MPVQVDRGGCAVVLLFLASVSGLVVAQGHADEALSVPDAVRNEVDKHAAALHPRVVETRRDIHRHPELGFREKRTSQLVAERLRALKFDDVRTQVGVTGVVGVVKGGKPGPVVAVRADMDALPIPELIDVPYKSTVPNVKHACGHDGHTAVALGVAEVLASIRASMPGTVKFLFQPAEEGDPVDGASGAVRMLKEGAFDNPAPEAIFGLHVMPTLASGLIGVNSGPAMASSNRFTIRITGKKTHGAYPHSGIDPIPIAAQIVMALQTIPSRQIDAQQPTVVSVGIINGGNRRNIIADSVELSGTVRSLSKDGPATVKTKMEAIVKGITSSFGATYTLEYVEGAPVTYNDPKLTEASLAALRAVVGDRVTTPAPQMAAEDFAYYQQRVPGFYYFLGVGNPAKKTTAMIHTEYFDLDEDALQLGVRSMATIVLDYLYRTKN
jgi:amidohydrolase